MLHHSEKYGMWMIAATYVGTVVGAGFASGREILQFFTVYGTWGLLGLGLTIVLFALIGAYILTISFSIGARSHHTLIEHAFGNKLGTLIDQTLTVFLIATTAAMASGAAATLFEQFGLARWIGSTALIIATVATVLVGIRGVIRAIGFVAPILIVSVIVLSVQAVVGGKGLGGVLAWKGDVALTNVPYWHVAALLYVTYNLMLAIPVLAPLGAVGTNRKTVFWGGFVGGLALGIGATAIHLAMAGSMPLVAASDIPLLNVAQSLPAWVPAAYSLLLLLEIFSTAVATLFGFAARMSESRPSAFFPATVYGGLGALLLGQFHFATLIGTLYPLIGIIGAFLIYGVIRKHFA